MQTTQIPDSGTEMVRGSKKAHGNLLDGARHEADPFPKRLTAAEKATTPTLTSGEQKRWQKAIKTIEKGWKTFVEVGLALKAIRDSRLYREDYESWEAFCREVVGASKTEANRQITDAQVATDLLTPNGVTAEEASLPMPANRAQARALAQVKNPAKRRQVWERVQAESGEMPVTAKSVEQIAHKLCPDLAPPPSARSSASPIAKKSATSIRPPAAGMDVLERLQAARRAEDWAIVDEVIEHLQAGEL